MPVPNYSDLARYTSEANEAAHQFGLDPAGAHNEDWDAFRHAYASAEMTREYGEGWARLLGDANELKRPGGFFDGEANMDLWNNARGREIGRESTSKEDSARRVKDALDRGDLMRNPSDPRVRYGDDYDGYPSDSSKAEDIKKKTENASTIPSPIAFDLDGDGIETISVAHGVLFDHAADGFAERTGWIGRDDGLLVRDINGNGKVDSGRELFGSETLLENGSKAANGFEALTELDVNADRVIDANDVAFSELRVWKDTNSNGHTDTGELLTLAEVGVQSINLTYTNSSYVDAQGNAHKQVGSYTTTDGQTHTATDVWVKTDTIYSVPTEWVNVPENIAALPDAQGYGKVRDLRQAMAMDATGELKALVTAFTQATAPEDRDTLVTQIIYHWAGVQDVDPMSRAATMIYGNAIGDARKLEALEEFMGEEWVGVWCWGTRDPNPHGRAAPVLLAAWDELKGLVYGQLMAESHLKPLLQKVAYRWDEVVGGIVGDLSAVAAALTEQIQIDRETGLTALRDFLHTLKGTGLLKRLDVVGFKAALVSLGADVVQTMSVALAGWTPGSTPTEGSDVLRGSNFDDLLDALGGNDVLDGRGGNDELRGGSGSDTYRFGRGDGHDTIVEDYSWGPSEIDRIEFKAGISPEDVHLARVSTVNGWRVSDDLKITIRDTGETLTVKNHFSENDHYAVEEIVFADGTRWDVEMIKSSILLGEAGNDELHGFNKRDDVIDGGAGDDVLEGGTGSDTYRFGRGDGHDLIIEDTWIQGETDRIEFKAGISPEDVHLARVRTMNGRLISDDLKLTIRDTGETLTVKNHFNESNRHAVEEIVFADGTRWDAETIKSLSLLGGAGNDELRGFNGRDDVLAGGAGNDTLAGGSGSDTYHFGLGDGLDMIDEGYTAGEDTVALGAGVTPADVTVRWTMQGDMTITLSDGSRLTVRGQADTWSLERGIEQLRFADGTVWDRAALAARALAATDGNDVIVGSYEDDILDGGAGNDHFQNLGGDDTYLFGVGDGQDVIEPTYGRLLFKPGIGQNDVSFARDGKDLIATVATSGDAVRIKAWFNNYSWQRIDRFDFDNGARLNVSDVFDKLGVSEDQEILYGSPGDDVLTGTEKDSTLHGREGNDTLVGSAGSDIYVFNSGDGVDIIEDSAGQDRIFYAGIQLTGGGAIVESGSVWQQKSGEMIFTYTVSQVTENGETYPRLSISGPDGTIQVNRWQAGDLGIVLEGAGAPPAKSGPKETYEGKQGTLFVGDASGNQLVGGAKSDLLAGGRGEDRLLGGEGNDFLLGDHEELPLAAGEKQIVNIPANQGFWRMAA
ncbi:protein of unknown function [Sterolibacterium denitrificans]|uniref:Haemolysin-type calcium binding-related domain-containing protein n=1 Tax=Sterolibacterium denitrificans TaxID=157592 RepID=A0A7Z7HQW6_9PROT|nr:calcium-binding protein [Sterolibacterium denitrificans]SMB26121.1 protein of unknown function [Sterolibacterium denitrificans]